TWGVQVSCRRSLQLQREVAWKELICRRDFVWHSDCFDVGYSTFVRHGPGESAMISKFGSTAVAAVIGLAIAFAGTTAKATNLITNGSFEQLTGGIGQI